jgi:predicted CXXCH cytochrome family protein
MNPSMRWQALGICATLCVALLLGCTPTEPATPARFPHATHLSSGALTCLNCHAVAEAAVTGQTHQPGYDLCKRCHDQGVGPGQKYSYDVSRTASASAGADHVFYSHKAHVPRTQGQCVRCHKAGPVSDQNPAALVPRMADCLQGCHQAEYDRVSCTRCHPTGQLAAMRPKTDIPHGGNYVQRHSHDAARKPRLCQACHAESFCTDCHDTSTGMKVELRRLDDINRDYQHRGDFVTRHATEARSHPAACVRCHQPSSCDSCHVRNHVSGNALGAVSQHPTGWMGSDPSNPNFHGRSARRRVIECSSCHDQGPATNCIRCHKVGAYGGKPHPAGWRSNIAPQTTEMCQYCHAR